MAESKAMKNKRKAVAAWVGLLGLIAVIGVFAGNGWFPKEDPLSGRKTGWFGRELPPETTNIWNPVSAPPSATPQLAKEYIYAGSRLIAVEDALGSAARPADLAVWRPANGTWWVFGSGGSQNTVAGWGTSGDIPVPGDYDGDGRTDFAVFRPSEGIWYVLRSGDGTVGYYSWGLATDKPAAADYDGDGRTDIAVWRPSNGTWYIVRSSDGGAIYQQFGLSGDEPAAADYDGDGRADIAVWRSEAATFYSINSSNGSLQIVNHGQSGDAPVPGDYDGDGRADYATRRGNLWIIRQSSNLQTQTITWEQSGDKPVQNDYDGDGRTDIAVWRDSNGTWYIRQSSKIGIAGQSPSTNNPYPNELRIDQWGTSGDIPVPAFYRR